VVGGNRRRRRRRRRRHRGLSLAPQRGGQIGERGEEKAVEERGEKRRPLTSSYQ
jgi:hypothetical protein